MRLALLGVAVLALACALLLLLRRPPPPTPPPSRVKVQDEPSPTRPSSPSLPAPSPSPPPVKAPPSGVMRAPSPSAPVAAPAPVADNDAAVSAWQARREERDFAYWDMKLAMLRKIKTCVGDKMGTMGAAEVDYHFKKQGDVWLADHADVRDPDANERDKLGAVDFRGADRELAQRCISEAFTGVTMPMTGATDELEEYEVRGQIMFPTSADRAWQQTGVNPQ